MEAKKYIIYYYNEKEHTVNYCALPQDWNGATHITRDNVLCTIYAVFNGTEKNILLAQGMVKQIEDTCSDAESALGLVERVVFDYMD